MPIFDHVMVVHPVAGRADRQAATRMLRERVQHAIEEVDDVEISTFPPSRSTGSSIFVSPVVRETAPRRLTGPRSDGRSRGGLL